MKRLFLLKATRYIGRVWEFPQCGGLDDIVDNTDHAISLLLHYNRVNPGGGLYYEYSYGGLRSDDINREVRRVTVPDGKAERYIMRIHNQELTDLWCIVERETNL